MKVKEDEKEKLTKEQKENIISNLKRVAIYYKEKLLGNIFLVIYDDDKVFEIRFTKENFMHLTGISSDIKPEKFYELCRGKKDKNRIRYIKECDIYTTIKHPYRLAKKKFEVFNQIEDLFTKDSWLGIEVSETTKIFSFGIGNLSLMVLCDESSSSISIPISLRKYMDATKCSHLTEKNATLIKINPYFKYEKIIYIKKKYNLNEHEETLSKYIDYKNIKN